MVSTRQENMLDKPLHDMDSMSGSDTWRLK